jgi:glucose-1-phosphatase
MVLPITIKGLTANSDGLYRLSDLDALMAETMGEYDAITDAATGVRAVSQAESAMESAAIYNLQGQRLDSLQRGVNIVDGTKILVK